MECSQDFYTSGGFHQCSVWPPTNCLQCCGWEKLPVGTSTMTWNSVWLPLQSAGHVVECTVCCSHMQMSAFLAQLKPECIEALERIFKVWCKSHSQTSLGMFWEWGWEHCIILCNCGEPEWAPHCHDFLHGCLLSACSLGTTVYPSGKA